MNDQNLTASTFIVGEILHILSQDSTLKPQELRSLEGCCQQSYFQSNKSLRDRSNRRWRTYGHQK